jgi:RNA polymerase sigma-70 factor (ECF subfamily)
MGGVSESGLAAASGGPRPAATEQSSNRAAGSGEPAVLTELGAASDAVLVVAIGRWNESALAEVYRRHGGTVRALAQRVLGPSGRADDVTQDVFIDLWNRPERFDPGRGSLRAFLVTIAHGRAVDVLRSDRARFGREERTARETATAGYDVENEMWDLAVNDQLKDAVRGLPDPERQAIELAYFGGHTYREVASLVGEPEGTIKSRIRSGLRRLRAALIQGGVEPTWIDR